MKKSIISLSLSLSVLVFAKPIKPENLHLEALSKTEVSISWEDRSDNESGFKIFRDGRLIATTNANVTTYKDSGLSASTTYDYKVVATDDSSKLSDYNNWIGDRGVVNDHFIEADIELGGEIVHKKMRCYYPSGINRTDNKSPVILFAGSGIDDDNDYIKYDKLLRVIASHGYTVYFVTHNYSQRYQYIAKETYKGFKYILDNTDDSPYLDLSRIGMIGFSSGASALIYTAYKLFSEDDGNKYGSNGKFIFQLSTNIAEGVEAGMVENFPSDTYFLTQIYDHSLPKESGANYLNEYANDPRTYIDIYNHINIPDDKKEFMIVRGARDSGLKAVHLTPRNDEDDLDRYAIYRPFLALADKAFYNNDIGYYASLGKGLDEVKSSVLIDHSDDPQGLFESVFGDIKPADDYPYGCYEDSYIRRDECLNALR
jgi:acetyl esterase/lipase